MYKDFFYLRSIRKCIICETRCFDNPWASFKIIFKFQNDKLMSRRSDTSLSGLFIQKQQNHYCARKNNNVFQFFFSCFYLFIFSFCSFISLIHRLCVSHKWCTDCTTTFFKHKNPPRKSSSSPSNTIYTKIYTNKYP